MKDYVVMVNYGLEGWKIHAERETFQQAYSAQQEAKTHSSEVVIFKPVKFTVLEEATELL